MQAHCTRHGINTFSLLASGAFGLAAACGDTGDDTTRTRVQPLEVACIEPDVPLPEEAWICGTDTVIECDATDGSHPDFIYVDLTDHEVDGEPLACDAVDVSDPGPFGVGDHTIVVAHVDDEGETICTSTLHVIDTTPPAVEPLAVELWPPNHKMTALSPYDCVVVSDLCDGDVELAFTWASSDEAQDDLGDGSTEPDIELTPDGVAVRAERSGTGDGRVYTLGWIATDDEGNFSEGVCHAVVPHDRGGDPALEGDAQYTLVSAEHFDLGPLGVDVHVVDGDPVTVVTGPDDEDGDD